MEELLNNLNFNRATKTNALNFACNFRSIQTLSGNQLYFLMNPSLVFVVITYQHGTVLQMKELWNNLIFNIRIARFMCGVVFQ